MEPYVIWFGHFADQAVEQLMFDPKGYEYLRDFVLKKLVFDASKTRLVARVREVMALGERPFITARCDCGRPAEFVVCARDESGVGFDRFCCRDCREPHGREEFIPLRFSSLNKFGVRIDQRLFLSQLRQACGLPARLTAEKAVAFFFPEATEQAAVHAPAAPVRKAKSNPTLPF